MISENRKVLLFVDNVPCHPDILQEDLKNIKIDFFPKNTTSQLQPCAASIIRSFKAYFPFVSTNVCQAVVHSFSESREPWVENSWPKAFVV